MNAGQILRIRGKAELLAGEIFGEGGDALVEMACQRAMAYCNREEIPPDMEQAVAALAAERFQGGPVRTLTRGDTSITYEAVESAASLLRPFVRLGRLKEDGA